MKSSDIPEKLMNPWYGKAWRFWVISAVMLSLYITFAVYDTPRFYNSYQQGCSKNPGRVECQQSVKFPRVWEIQPQIRIISSQVLNVRAGPGVQYNKVASLLRGEQVVLLGESKKLGESVWVYIAFDNRDGWVNSKYLAKPK